MKKILLSIFLWGTLLSASAQVPSNVPSNGLIGYFGFDGNANDAVGSSTPSSNNASLTNDRNGISNSAYQFYKFNNPSVIIYTDSSNPLFKIGNTHLSFSINFWVNTSTDGYGLIMGSYGWGYGVVLSNNNKVQLTYLSSNNPQVWTTNVSNSALTKNTWQMVTITRVGNTISIYINGILDNTFTNSPNILTYTNKSNCWFGANGQTKGAYFDGILDDIGLWNRALTASEINDLYIGCKLSISKEPISQTVNINQHAQFTISTNDNLASYQWQSDLGTGFQNLSNAGLYSGAQNDTLIVSSVSKQNNNKNFRCIVKSGPCLDTSNLAMLKVFDNVGVGNLNIENIKVYPLPSSTQVIIDNYIYCNMGYTAKIVNSIGQQIFQSVINQQQFVIDANTMGGAGVYTLYISDANNKVVGEKKLVLQ